MPRNLMRNRSGHAENCFRFPDPKSIAMWAERPCLREECISSDAVPQRAGRNAQLFRHTNTPEPAACLLQDGRQQGEGWMASLGRPVHGIVFIALHLWTKQEWFRSSEPEHLLTRWLERGLGLCSPSPWLLGHSCMERKLLLLGLLPEMKQVCPLVPLSQLVLNPPDKNKKVQSH